MHRASHALVVALLLIGAPVEAARPEAGNWRLQSTQDAFTGQTRCSLGTRDGLIRYQPGAIGFHFAHRRDTLAAWYRIDGGGPVRWEDRYAALVAAGVEIDGSGLDDPTAGIVWIPQAELATARTVIIRLTTRDRPRRFELTPLTPLLADAARQGCRFLGGGRK